MASATPRSRRSQYASACSSVIVRSVLEQLSLVRGCRQLGCGANLAVRQVAILEGLLNGRQIEQRVRDTKMLSSSVLCDAAFLVQPFHGVARGVATLAWLPVGAMQVELAQLDKELRGVASDGSVAVHQVVGDGSGVFDSQSVVMFWLLMLACSTRCRRQLLGQR